MNTTHWCHQFYGEAIFSLRSQRRGDASSCCCQGVITLEQTQEHLTLRRTLKRGLDCLRSPVLEPLLLKSTETQGKEGSTPSVMGMPSSRKTQAAIHTVIWLGQGLRMKSPLLSHLPHLNITGMKWKIMSVPQRVPPITAVSAVLALIKVSMLGFDLPLLFLTHWSFFFFLFFFLFFRNDRMRLGPVVHGPLTGVLVKDRPVSSH